MVRRTTCWSMALLAVLIVQGSAVAQAPVRNLRPSEIMMLLDETVDGELFQKPRTFSDSLAMINLHLSRRGAQLPFWVDVRAFKEESPEMPELAEMEVLSRDRGPRPKVWRVLQDLLDSLPTRNGAFVVKPGYVEITTNERARFSYAEPVMLQVRNQPLGMVLNDLFEQSGVGIVVDPKVARKLREPVSVTISQPMPLNEVLSVVLNMQKLRYCAMGRINKVYYVTTPENALRTWREQEILGQFSLDTFSAVIGRNLKTPVVDVAQW